jgi:transcriptional regulator with XRE-family HTH domain
MTRLRHERHARNWSTARLAEVIGCDRSLISLWELGHRTPTGVRKRALENVFGLPLDVLLSPYNESGPA